MDEKKWGMGIQPKHYVIIPLGETKSDNFQNLLKKWKQREHNNKDSNKQLGRSIKTFQNAKESAKTIDQVIRGMLRGDSFYAEVFLLVFIMEKHGKGLTSEHFFMEDSKSLFQTEALA